MQYVLVCISLLYLTWLVLYSLKCGDTVGSLNGVVVDVHDVSSVFSFWP